jgi:hypothetical protein
LDNGTTGAKPISRRRRRGKRRGVVKMMAFLEELVVCIAISLGVRAATAVAEVLFVPGKTAKPEPPQTCSRCSNDLSADIPLHRHDAAKATLE